MQHKGDINLRREAERCAAIVMVDNTVVGNGVGIGKKW